MLTLKEVQSRITRWNRRNFPEQTDSQTLLGVGEEVGELMHAHLKAEQGIRGTAEEHAAAKRDAVGDIVNFLACYCSKSDIDFEQAVLDALTEVETRDWVKFPKNGRTE